MPRKRYFSVENAGDESVLELRNLGQKRGKKVENARSHRDRKLSTGTLRASVLRFPYNSGISFVTLVRLQKVPVNREEKGKERERGKFA